MDSCGCGKKNWNIGWYIFMIVVMLEIYKFIGDILVLKIMEIIKYVGNK